MSNYLTKTYLKNATGVDRSLLLKKTDLANLKPDVYKLDIDKWKSVSNNLNNLKTKVDKLDIGKLEKNAVDLSKLSNAVKNDVVKKDVYNAKIKNIEGKTADITNIATKTTLDAKINEVKGKIPSITNLATTAALTAVENKIPNVDNLVKNTDYNTTINEIEKQNYWSWSW